MLDILLQQIRDLISKWFTDFTTHAQHVENKLDSIDQTASDIKTDADNLPDIKDNTAAVITPINNIKPNTDSIVTSSGTTATNTTAIMNQMSTVSTNTGRAAAFAEDCATNTLDIVDKVTTIASDTTQIRADHVTLENDLDKIYEAIKWSCVNTIMTETESGASPLSFNTDIADELEALYVDCNYTQAGTGDPSPDNVRAITPVSSASLVVNENTISISFGTSIAKGILDPIAGILTINEYYAELTRVQGKYEASGGYYWYSSASYANIPGIFSLNSELVSDRFMPHTNITVTTSEGNMTFYVNNIIRWKEQGSLSATDYNTYLTSNPIQICYKLATPIVITLTPETINAIKGINSISTNTNGNIEVTYKESVKHYLDKQE